MQQNNASANSAHRAADSLSIVYTERMTNMNGDIHGYMRQGRIFLDQAHDELTRDDLRQASEKGWGATIQLLKAYAEERGLEHDRHAKLYGVIARLVAEADDDSLRTYFNEAGGLHENFYEGGFTYREVSDSLGQVTRFVDKVETLLNGRNGA